MEGNISVSKIYAYIIIGSDNNLKTYTDYASSTAYYHNLLKCGIPPENIYCLCNQEYFNDFYDNGWVSFQTKDKKKIEFPSIQEKFRNLNFSNLPKVNDPNSIVYIMLFNSGSNISSFNQEKISYLQILYSIFTSIKASQIIFVDSSNNSGLLIDTYKKLQESLSKIPSFPENIQNQMTSLFFFFKSLKNLKEYQTIINHFQYTNIAYLDKNLLYILLKITNYFLASKNPSYTHFLENIQNIQLGSDYNNFSEFKADALFVSKTKIEFPKEFALIKEMILKFSLDGALQIFNSVFQQEYFSLFSSFIKNIDSDEVTDHLHIDSNISRIKYQNFLIPITIFTSVDSKSNQTFYPSVPIMINSSRKSLPLSSSFRSTMLDLLFVNPTKNIIYETIQSYFKAIKDENGDTPQYFSSASNPFTILKANPKQRTRRTRNQDPISSTSIKVSDNIPKANTLQNSHNSSNKQSSNDLSDSSLEFESSSSSIDHQNVEPTPIIEVPEELFEISNKDLVYYPYQAQQNRHKVPKSEYNTGQFFKCLVVNLNHLLQKNMLIPLKLYPENDLPKDYDKNYLSTWIDFYYFTKNYIKTVLIPQFSYYMDSFGYLFQSNYHNLKILLKLLFDTIISLQSSSEFQEFIIKCDKSFDVDEFIEKL